MISAVGDAPRASAIAGFGVNSRGRPGDPGPAKSTVSLSPSRLGRAGRGEGDLRPNPLGPRGGGPCARLCVPAAGGSRGPCAPPPLRPLIVVDEAADLCLQVLFAAAGQPGPGRKPGGIDPDRPG